MSEIRYIDVERYPLGVEAYFHHEGRRHYVTRLESDGTANNYGRASIALIGAFARAWIADPCTRALEDSLHSKRLWESDADRDERIARRRAREQLQREHAEAKSKKVRRRDW